MSQSFIAFSQDGRNVRDTGKKVPIDICKLRINYQFKFVQDTLGSDPLYDSEFLEIGDSISRYYSSFGDYIDSLLFNARRVSTRGNDAISLRRWMKSNWQERYEDCYMNYPRQGVLTVSTAIVRNEYVYEEPIPKFRWVFRANDSTQNVMGYKCRVAHTSFRGRNYEVWFTDEIPIAKGPWKFSGLPGLILRVKEKSGLFSWLAVEITKPVNTNIHSYNPKKGIYVVGAPTMRIVRTSRNTVRKLQRMAWEDPIGLDLSFGMKYMSQDPKTGKMIEMKSGDKQDPYCPPLELE